MIQANKFGLVSTDKAIIIQTMMNYPPKEEQSHCMISEQEYELSVYSL